MIDAIDDLARQIAAGRRRLEPLPGLLADASYDAGYVVQAAANALLAEELGPVVGHKIGGTTSAMREYLRVREPLAGEVFASTVHGSGAVLERGAYRRPGVETEIAVRLGRALPPRPQPYGRDEVATAVSAMMASIEIVDDRYTDFRRCGGATLIADNAFDAGCVLGQPAVLDPDVELAALGARTLVDGELVAEGTAAALMGHPLEALAWLATRRSADGHGLPAGCFVTLGSMTPVQWIDRPGRWRIEVDALGAVEVTFS